MSDDLTDRELLERTWKLYDEAFAAHVGEILTPEEHLASEAGMDWAAQAFMFAYALGSIAGGSVVAPDDVPAETDLERVEDIVADVVAIAESDAFEASSERVLADIRE